MIRRARVKKSERGGRESWQGIGIHRAVHPQSHSSRAAGRSLKTAGHFRCSSECPYLGPPCPGFALALCIGDNRKRPIILKIFGGKRLFGSPFIPGTISPNGECFCRCCPVPDNKLDIHASVKAIVVSQINDLV